MQKMLIIDDEPAIRFAMSRYFRHIGYRVDCAQNLIEAKTRLLTEIYSIVIADLRLAWDGNLDGLEIVKSIHQQHPGTPIIVLSAYRSAEIENDLSQYGDVTFLHKPKPLPEVAQIVASLLAA